MRNGYIIKYGANGNVVYAKNPNNLEMWFDSNENLTHARWPNGYEQFYENGKIVA